MAPRAKIPARKMVMGIPGAVVGDAPEGREKNFDWSHTTGYLIRPNTYSEGLQEISIDQTRV